MVVGQRIREFREHKNLSQGDIEGRTGLLRCYISRVENGHTVPALETIEKLARALEVPTYHIFYDGEMPPAAPRSPKAEYKTVWGSSGRDARMLNKFRNLLSRMNNNDASMLLSMASHMATRGSRKKKTT
jgi:transcriptional regulator with XRE-family HTH domain